MAASPRNAALVLTSVSQTRDLEDSATALFERGSIPGKLYASETNISTYHITTAADSTHDSLSFPNVLERTSPQNTTFAKMSSVVRGWMGIVLMEFTSPYLGDKRGFRAIQPHARAMAALQPMVGSICWYCSLIRHSAQIGFTTRSNYNGLQRKQQTRLIKHGLGLQFIRYAILQILQGYICRPAKKETLAQSDFRAYSIMDPNPRSSSSGTK